MISMVWEPVNEGNGWRAWWGSSADGRLWKSRELCQAYIDGMAKGWLDRDGEDVPALDDADG
jgi:hypothetical protein